MQIANSVSIIHIALNEALGGGEIQLIDLIDNLSKENTSQLVICYARSELSQYLKEKKVKLLLLPTKKGFHPTTIWQLKKLYAKETFALIHVHDAQAHTLAILSVLFARQTIPIILSRKVAFPIKNHLWSRWKYNHPLIKKIICVSHAVKEIMATIVNDPSKLTVIYDGIDLNVFKKSANHKLHSQYSISQPFLIGIIGSLVPIKDHYTFIKMASLLHNQGLQAQFIIIGLGKLQSELQDYVQQLKLDKVVIFAGYRDDIPEIIGELDCLVVTSFNEGLCRVILEAMAAEVPVVASNTTGIKELITHEENGLLATVGNARDFAQKVNYLLNSPAYSEESIKKAKWFVQNFDRSMMAQAILSIYRGLFI